MEAASKTPSKAATRTPRVKWISLVVVYEDGDAAEVRGGDDWAVMQALGAVHHALRANGLPVWLKN